MENFTQWLDIRNNIQEFWVEPPPDLSCGYARYQDMLYRVQLGRAQITSGASVRIGFRQSLIGQIITGEKFNMKPKLLDFLCGADVVQDWVGVS